MLTSARNQLSGKVTRIESGAVNDEVELELAGGARLVSIITHESVKRLGLKVGIEAIALIKASSVIIAVEGGKALKLSARNRLSGTISKKVRGAVNTEVVMRVAGDTALTAIVTNDAADELKLEVGKTASAIVKASSVILGVVG